MSKLYIKTKINGIVTEIYLNANGIVIKRKTERAKTTETKKNG